ncbi:MAG: hypothetical protein QMC83_05085 [Thermodesulfovibrionales bacterium]|nr:hypothetical protein [Thermodesulfovibrionales bacterium]
MRKILACLVILTMTFLATWAFAHTPICNCFDNGDGTITCEGGFSDGSSAAGVNMSVVDKAGKVLVKGKMDKNSEFTFKKPNVPYTVIFDAGPGHVVKVEGKNIK